MQQIFNQLLQFLQQGISAIFRFVQLIWQWTVGQITGLTRVPWQDWPLLKQILLVLSSPAWSGPCSRRARSCGRPAREF